MKQATLGLYYFCKYVELIFLLMWTALTCSSGSWFIQRIRD